jgi:hypothetical protein
MYPGFRIGAQVGFILIGVYAFLFGPESGDSCRERSGFDFESLNMLSGTGSDFLNSSEYAAVLLFREHLLLIGPFVTTFSPLLVRPIQ